MNQRRITERVAGIGPAPQPWRGRALPLRHTRACSTSTVASIAVTVRTNDIALRDLGEDRFRACSADHLRYDVPLFRRVPMVELHYKMWKVSAAVEARHCSQLRKEFRLVLSVSGLSFDIARDSRRARCEEIFGLNPAVGPTRVTVGTDDVALRYLGD